MERSTGTDGPLSIRLSRSLLDLLNRTPEAQSPERRSSGTWRHGIKKKECRMEILEFPDLASNPSSTPIGRAVVCSALSFHSLFEKS